MIHSENLVHEYSRRDEEGNVVEEWTSTKDVHIIRMVFP